MDKFAKKVVDTITFFADAIQASERSHQAKIKYFEDIIQTYDRKIEELKIAAPCEQGNDPMTSSGDTQGADRTFVVFDSNIQTQPKIIDSPDDSKKSHEHAQQRRPLTRSQRRETEIVLTNITLGTINEAQMMDPSKEPGRVTRSQCRVNMSTVDQPITKIGKTRNNKNKIESINTHSPLPVSPSALRQTRQSVQKERSKKLDKARLDKELRLENIDEIPIKSGSPANKTDATPLPIAPGRSNVNSNQLLVDAIELGRDPFLSRGLSFPEWSRNRNCFIRMESQTNLIDAHVNGFFGKSNAVLLVEVFPEICPSRLVRNSSVNWGSDTEHP